MRRFGELESVVMERIWRLGRPVVVRDVYEDLKAERAIAYTTVMTVMDKLHSKGWLRRESRGRAYEYEAVAAKEAYTARLMRDALATSENQAAAFVHFLGQLTEQETRALQAALEICPPAQPTADDADAAASDTPAADASGIAAAAAAATAAPAEPGDPAAPAGASSSAD
nr:BlaI/MecI/CopY family transcriptional regulator [Actinospica durhamensis]